jgi:phosphatidyl-myo-inositol dimannoside synthase
LVPALGGGAVAYRREGDGVTESLRVLALVTDGFGGSGGIAQYNRDLISGLAASRCVGHVRVLARTGDATLAVVPDKIHHRPPLRSKPAYAMAAIQAALMDGPWDWVFCGHVNLMPLAAASARVAGARLWLQVHGIEAWEPLRGMRRRAVERADFVTAVSRYTRSRFLTWADVDPARVRVLPNTVAEVFEPGPVSASVISRHGLFGKKVVLTVGRLSATERYKGHDRVIQALPQILKANRDAVYLVVGDGDDRPRLEALARQHGVAEQVIFAGAVGAAELPSYYRAADLFVMPSTGEGFGIVFLEAMACGTRALGAAIDASRDPLQDGQLGEVVPLEDIAPAVIRLLAQPAQPLALSARTRSTFGRPQFNAALDALVATRLT